MLSKESFGAVVGILALSGCLTVFNAQEAQRGVEGRAVGAARPSAALDLADCSLEELVGFALTNRPSTTSAALAALDARLALRTIEADAPLVSATPWNAVHANVSAGHDASSAANSSLRWQTEGNARAGLSLDILLFDFGRNQAAARAQAENVIVAEHEFLTAGYAVFEEVSGAYFSLLTKDALLEVALTNETECALRLRQAEDMLDAGEATRLDVTSARLDWSQARADVVVASNEVVTAGAELMRALGVDVTRGTRNEVFPPTGQALSVVQRGFAPTDFGVDAAFALARTNAPSVVIARARLRAASRQVDAAIADLFPSVTAEVGVNWIDPLWYWHWGVGVAQTVFAGFKKTTAVDRAVLKMRQAAVAVDDAEQELSLSLETAIAVRDDAVKALEIARLSVQNAKDNLDTVKAQYQAGDASRVDYTMALSKYATSLGGRVKAFYTGQMAESKLFALLGRLPEFDEDEIKEK